MRNINNLKKRLKNFYHIFWKTIISFSKKELSLVILLIILISVTIFQITEIKKAPENVEVSIKKGIYNEALIGEIQHLNPLFADYNEIDRDICSLLFSGLTKYNPETGHFEGDLADYTINEDNTIYTFVLKDGLKWHDGTVITAEDVYFTYHDIIQDLTFENPKLKSDFNGIEITKIDDRTVEFKLSEPNSFFITNTTTGIVPKYLLKDYKPEDMDMVEFNTKPVGSGPYTLTSFQKGGTDGKMIVTLESFDEYYAKKPQISKIKFIIFSNEENLFLEKDTFNGINKVPNNIVKDLTDDSRLKLLPYKMPQYTAIFMNTDSEYLKDSKTRLALSKAIDKQALLNQLDSVEIINTPLLELNESEWIHKYNVEESRGALYDSGWKIPEETTGTEDANAGEEPKYRIDNEGKTLELNLITIKYDKDTKNYVESKIISDFLKEKWADVGIKINVNEYEPNDFFEMMKLRNYDLILHKQSLGYNKDTYSFWHSSQTTTEGLNLSNYKSFAVDSLIQEIRSTFDDNDKQDLLKQLDEVISQEVPAIFLYTPIYYYASDFSVKNLNLNNLAFRSDRFANISDWYITEIQQEPENIEIQ